MTDFDPADLDAAREDVLALVARAEALIPRIDAEDGIHAQERLARMANAYSYAAHGLLGSFGPLRDETIEHPRLLALRRALKPWRDL